MAKLTLKRREWLKVYIETGNATEAAMQAYICKDRKSASVIGAQNLSMLKGNVKDKMEVAGLTDEVLFSKLAEGLDADRVEVAKHQGHIGDEKAYTDYATRSRYLELALKLKGLLKDIVKHEGSIPVEFTGKNAEKYVRTKLSNGD